MSLCPQVSDVGPSASTPLPPHIRTNSSSLTTDRAKSTAGKDHSPPDADRSNMFAHVLETTPENRARALASGSMLPEQQLLSGNELIPEDVLAPMPKQAPPPPFTLTWETARVVQLNMLALKVRAALQEPISVKVGTSLYFS